jgi:hypothetical protein
LTQAIQLISFSHGNPKKVCSGFYSNYSIEIC